MKLNSSNRNQTPEIKSSAEITAKNVTKLVNGGKIPTPKEIMAYLDERVIGQQEAKKRLSIAVHNHYKRVFSNVCGLVMMVNLRILKSTSPILLCLDLLVRVRLF